MLSQFTIDAGIEIASPIEEVWAYATASDDWRRPVVRAVRKLTDGEMRVGSQYENDIRVFGMSSRVVNEITVIEQPSRLSWRQVNDAPVVTQEGHYVLASGDAGTLFSIRGVYRITSWRGRPRWLVQSVTRRIVATRLLPQLKAAVEQQPT